MNTIRDMVIVGGGQAAGWAAKTLRDLGYAQRLSVVADESHDFYERPPLSKDVLSGEREPAQLRLFPQDTIDALNLHWHRPRRACVIERQSQNVILDDGTSLPYDRLLLATGSRPRLPDPQWAQLEGVVVLRSADDALLLRQRLHSCRRMAIVGGGWIGLEVAAMARTRSIEVVIYERGTHLCGRSIGADVAERLASLHREQDITLRLQCGDLSLTQTIQGVEVRTEADALVYDTVLVGAGAQLNTELAQAAGLKVDHGIVVDGSGRTSDPAIYAAGDVAQHPVHGLCVQSWANAQNQGIASARGLLGLDANYDDVPWLWSDQHGMNIQILGLHSQHNISVHRASADGRDIYFQLDKQSRLQHMVAFSDPRAIKLGRRWMATSRPLNASDLANPNYDLMTLR